MVAGSKEKNGEEEPLTRHNISMFQEDARFIRRPRRCLAECGMSLDPPELHGLESYKLGQIGPRIVSDWTRRWRYRKCSQETGLASKNGKDEAIERRTPQALPSWKE